MADLREDLKATSDSIRRDAQLVAELEEQKTLLDPADPRVQHLAERLDVLIGQMSTKASAEKDLVREIRYQDADRQSRPHGLD